MLLVGGTLAGTAAPAAAGGGVDINGWCVATFQNPWHAELVHFHVFGWACQYGQDPGGRQSVDMNAACRRTYGSNSTAGYTSYNNPYSWYCT
ncbi:hypothetical protein AB0A63_01755 [Lentzea sp. NPDC042327]|uniref:hypothetical protein n=1 Tax=Lentzea sp. NPDC042327 TaxID=3154801 RepID=UPI0033D8E14B